LKAGLEAVGVKVQSIPVRACWLVQYGEQKLWQQLARALRYGVPDRGSAALTTWIRDTSPEVVHVNCLPHLRGAAAARTCGLPVVWHVREILAAGPRRRWFAGRLGRDATRIVAVSEAVAGWLRDEGLGGRVEVVHNGVDPPVEDSDRDVARAALGLPTDGVVVGFFSQLVEHKGALDFVRAAHAAAEREKSLRFLLAGHGAEASENEVRKAITEGSARDRIDVVTPQKDIWPLLAAVDAVAVTTLWPDPLPRVVMEAMAAGRPVIAYEGGGVPEMVVAGETGLLIEPGDLEGLTNAMVNLARDSGRREAFGSAGQKRALECFSVAGHVDRMETILREAVSDR
jgi:glycosyltransferase involved in cell wall biosynthesis